LVWKNEPGRGGGFFLGECNLQLNEEIDDRRLKKKLQICFVLSTIKCHKEQKKTTKTDTDNQQKQKISNGINTRIFKQNS
jgi:Holliday junction resolvase RusA-like endonuclease